MLQLLVTERIAAVLTQASQHERLREVGARPLPDQ
jgi:hypothetical protein